WVLPGLAFGLEDFLGTRSFKAGYFVLTKVFRERNFEISFGWGWQRLKGPFGGALWMPFRQCQNAARGIAFAAEYDCTPYSSQDIERHPRGRKQFFPINFGI